MRASSILEFRKLLSIICEILCKDHLSFDEASKEQQARQTK